MRTPSPPWVTRLQPYVPGKPIEELERELGIRDAVKLASNENPRGPSPRAVEAMHDALTDTHLYPDAGTWSLRERLATHLDVEADEIVVGNGSNELLTLLVRAFSTPDDHAVISQWSFIAYKVVLGAAGVPTTVVPMRDMTHDLAAMAAACNDKTRLLMVANPNNPTGTYNPTDEVLHLLDATPEHVLIVMDEAYFEYAGATDYPNGLELRDRRENLVVTRTFSKVYGLAGVRVGYGVVPSFVADAIGRIREPFNVNRIAQAGAIAALDDVAFLRETVELNQREMEELSATLTALGLEWLPSQGNFLLVRSPIPGRELYERLLRRGVIVRPLTPYGMSDHVRITVGLKQENERLAAALADVLKV